MTRVASDVVLTVIGKMRANLHAHRDHIPRNFLFRILVAGEIPLHMTVIALHPERDGKRAHRGYELLPGQVLQYLEILRLRRWAFLRPFLGQGADRQQQCNDEDETHVWHRNTAFGVCQFWSAAGERAISKAHRHPVRWFLALEANVAPLAEARAALASR